MQVDIDYYTKAGQAEFCHVLSAFCERMRVLEFLAATKMLFLTRHQTCASRTPRIPTTLTLRSQCSGSMASEPYARTRTWWSVRPQGPQGSTRATRESTAQVTEEGHSVMAHVHGFEPYFYVECPEAS